MKKLLVASALAMALSGPAFADIVYTFGGGSDGQQAIAQFDFSDANTLTLTLTDTSPIHDLASILTDFHFDLSATPTSTSLGTITDTGGMETCTTSTGKPPHITTCSNDPDTDATGLWTLTPSGAHIDMVANGQPQSLHPYGIGNDTFITNAAQDGLTNPQHNPVLLGPVSFDITFTGLTTIPTVSGVVFSFGTTPDLVPGECTSGNNCQPIGETPEPQSLLLVTLGLLALLYVRRSMA